MSNDTNLFKKYLLSVSNTDTPKLFKDEKGKWVLSFSDNTNTQSTKVILEVSENYTVNFGGLKLVIRGNESLKLPKNEIDLGVKLGVKEDTLWINVKDIEVTSIEKYPVLINGQSNERSKSTSSNKLNDWLEQINFEKRNDRLIAQMDSRTDGGKTVREPKYFLDFEALYSSNTKSTRTRLLLKEASSTTKNTITTPNIDKIVISHHPFSVARATRYSLDSDTDDIVAQWDSEEPTGLWLFPVLSVDLDLPPQGVAQEMERGRRFWVSNKPTIELDKPVNTRICGLTKLNLAHNELASRRYVLPPNAIEHWLSNSIVQKLTFEAVYPLQVSYEKDKSSDTSIAIDEIGNHILSPATPWDPVNPINPVKNIVELEKNLNLSKWLSPGMVNYASNVENKVFWEKWLDQYKFRRLTHIGAGIALQRRVARHNIINEGQPKKLLNLSGKEVTAKLVPPIVNEDYYKEILGDKKSYLRKTAYPIAEKDLGQLTSDFFSEKSTQHIGLLGLFEFQSELNAVLRNLNATSFTTKIDYLVLSALGATTQLEASFDEGRTSFHVEVVDAHSVKLIKTRIGRIACIKNKAKHIVEYIVSVCPSSQFAEEQGEKENLTDEDKIKYLKLGWPIIRKSNEYIQIEEQRRLFQEEENLDPNQAPIIKASHFPSNKIYVNSAWGEELEHGYKIPLFKENDPSGFYVKPVYALVCFGKDGEDANHYHEQPHYAFFYTNTQEGKGADSDAWEHFISIDFRADAYTPALYECIDSFGNKERPIVTPALSTKWQSDPKFDWLVRSESPCNLVHGRDGANEPLLANVSVISIDRREAKNPRLGSLQSSSKTGFNDIYKLLEPNSSHPNSISAPLQQAAELRTLEALINRLPAELEKIITGFANPSEEPSCQKIKGICKQKINDYFDEGKERLNKIDSKTLIPREDLIYQFLDKQFGAIEKELELAKKFVDEKKAPFDSAISELMLATDHKNLQIKLRQLCETELLTLIDKTYNRIDYQAKEAFIKIDDNLLKTMGDKCQNFDTTVGTLISSLNNQITIIDNWIDVGKSLTNLQNSIINEIYKYASEINNAANLLSSLEKQFQELIPKCSGLVQDVLNISLIKVQSLEKSVNNLSEENINVLFNRIKFEIDNNSNFDLEGQKKFVKECLEFINEIRLNLTVSLQSLIDIASISLDVELENFKVSFYGTLWSVYTNAHVQSNNLIGYLAYLSGNEPNATLDQIKTNFNQLHTKILKTLNVSANKVKELKDSSHSSIKKLVDGLKDKQVNLKNSISTEWEIQRQKILNQVSSIPCDEIDKIIETIKDQYINYAETWLKDTVNEGLAKIIDQRALEQYKDLQKKIETTYSAYKSEFESKQSAVLTLSEMITHPPQLPNLNLSCQSLALAYAGDTSAIINTAPFIARIDAAKGALSALGIDTAHNAITDTLDVINGEFDAYKEKLQNKLCNCLKKLGGLDSLFSKFEDVLNSKEFKIVNIAKDGRVSLKPELQKFIPQERAILESDVFAIALNNTFLNVVVDLETEVITAKVRSNWALKFNGQALVVFENVQLTYASNGDYHFELDPQNVRLHPSLKFISDLMSAVENSLPPGIEFEKGSQNQIVGVKASLVQQFPGFSIAAATIGPFAIQSGFGLRFASGAMELVAGFGLGTQYEPVYIQFGVYGGGGWLGANVLYNPNSANLPVVYEGFMGIAVGSMQQFNIAGIARGSYAILIFAYAKFNSSTTYLEAGLLVNGSARILGYINAHLTLKLSVEYNGSKAHGKGEIDLEIEICWCYSVHIHSAVDQDF